MNHEAMDFAAPQVYWMGAHNVGEQLTNSYNEYKALSDKPFVPIGPTFGGILPNGAWWEPSAAELKDFIAWCKASGIDAYGFYSLDWIFQHWSESGKEWLEAISGADFDLPEPEPEPAPVDGLRYRVCVPRLNVRKGPGTQHADIGDLVNGDVVQVLDIAGDSAWVRHARGWSCVRQGTVEFMELVE